MTREREGLRVDKVKLMFDGASRAREGMLPKKPRRRKTGNDCISFDDTASVEATIDA
jgi:hypothetical protein